MAHISEVWFKCRICIGIVNPPALPAFQDKVWFGMRKRTVTNKCSREGESYNLSVLWMRSAESVPYHWDMKYCAGRAKSSTEICRAAAALMWGIPTGSLVKDTWLLLTLKRGREKFLKCSKYVAVSFARCAVLKSFLQVAFAGSQHNVQSVFRHFSCSWSTLNLGHFKCIKFYGTYKS